MAVSETKERIESLGKRCLPLATNLETLSASEAGNIVLQCVSSLGRLDILVNNAGIIRRADAVDLTQDDWHDVMQVNLDSAFYLSQAAARHMMDCGGGKI